MTRSAAIENSLSAFVCGIIGFFPIVGLIPAIWALVCWKRVRRQYRNWNPAEGYLKYGAVLAMLGLLNSGLAALILVMAVANSLIG